MEGEGADLANAEATVEGAEGQLEGPLTQPGEDVEAERAGGGEDGTEVGAEEAEGVGVGAGGLGDELE